MNVHFTAAWLFLLVLVCACLFTGGSGLQQQPSCEEESSDDHCLLQVARGVPDPKSAGHTSLQSVLPDRVPTTNSVSQQKEPAWRMPPEIPAAVTSSSHLQVNESSSEGAFRTVLIFFHAFLCFTPKPLIKFVDKTFPVLASGPFKRLIDKRVEKESIVQCAKNAWQELKSMAEPEKMLKFPREIASVLVKTKKPDMVKPHLDMPEPGEGKGGGPAVTTMTM
eukprot:gnl/TRDRNA2_/TRDRNA2_186575_c0_seq1.p1 gnl/TRDRNA2_/TRDRNA2_186575_c0~~gnl/TRDRNA2_/TRDRNA2_186575_c0_seq1.p1  ORF type:complete len:222 (+),score=38.11 gnl/TRDRNA2_/TRDRNA2_186575_c0_seq1:147-812(+)